MFGTARQRFAEVCKCVIELVLLQRDLSELEPGFGLLRLQANRLLKLRARLVEVQSHLVDPAEAVVRGGIVRPQFEVVRHLLLSRVELLLVEEYARLGVEEARIVEVELFGGGQRLLRLRVQLHLVFENADIVVESRMLRREFLRAQQSLERFRQMAGRTLVECYVLTGSDFAALRLRVGGIRGQGRLEGVARLGKLARLQQRVSIRTGILCQSTGSGQNQGEHASRMTHCEAVSTIAMQDGNAGSRIIGPRMAGIFSVAGLAVVLMLGSQSAATQAAQGSSSSASSYQQGQTAFAAHHFAEAANFFAQAEAQNPGRSDALLMEGKSFANVNRYAESDQVLRAYVAQHPDSSDALFMLGFVLNREDKVADSLKVYTQAAHLATPKSDDLKVVALDYVLLNDYPDAIHWMERAVAFDPKNEEAWYGLGRCYYSQSRFADAENAFRHALALNTEDVKAEANLGLAYEMDNHPDDAEHAYQAAVALADKDPHTDEWPWLDYGSFLLEHDRPADALPLLQRAVTVAPRCAECHGKLGRALTLTGKADAGIAELRQAVDLSPKDPKLHYDLGRAYRAAGQLDRAKAEMALSAKLYGSKDTAPQQ